MKHVFDFVSSFHLIDDVNHQISRFSHLNYPPCIVATRAPITLPVDSATAFCSGAKLATAADRRAPSFHYIFPPCCRNLHIGFVLWRCCPQFPYEPGNSVVVLYGVVSSPWVAFAFNAAFASVLLYGRVRCSSVLVCGSRHCWSIKLKRT